MILMKTIKTTGIAVGAIYITLTALSITHYPHPFTPLNDFLSQLGNSNLNPTGAIYYNLAVILAGATSILFYHALTKWYSERSGKQLPKYTPIICTMNGLAVALSGVFPESTNYPLHVAASYMIFITFIPILLTINKALLQLPDYNRTICIYGYTVAAINIILLITVTMMFMGNGPGIESIMEWLAVFTYIGWIAALAIKSS